MLITEIESLIMAAVAEVLRDKGIDAAVGPDFQLFGTGSAIDSLDLVGIVVQLEEGIVVQTGRTIEIVDENSVVNDDSPFRTVSTLAKLTQQKLEA